LNKPILSVIIGTHNSEKYIERCLKSLCSQSYERDNFEIIVVDDGSNDKSVEISKRYADKVIETKPCTISKARNIGVDNSNGEYLAFIDSDCEATNGWIKNIITSLSENEAVTGPVLNGNENSLVAWAEYFVEFGGYHEYRKKSDIRFMPGCNGACIKKNFLKIGGFIDARISEDVVFGESLRKNGSKIWFIPNIMIKHLCRTKKQVMLSNMKLLGKYFVVTRRTYPEIKYTNLINGTFYVPIIFLSKLLFTTKYSIQAKKFHKFILSFPIIISAINSFCSGINQEIQNNN